MILAIETSSPKAGLALWDQKSGKLFHEESFSTNRAHNSVIFGYAEEILKKCDRKIEKIAVGLGPGSYSGVRVGIALANGLSLAMNIPAFGVSSLLAYGEDKTTSPNYAVIGDARRKSRFIALISNGLLTGEPELIPEEKFLSRLNELRETGEIDAVYTPDQRVAEEVSFAEISHPTAAKIAQIAANTNSPEGGKIRLEPHYLRPPYITTPKKR